MTERIIDGALRLIPYYRNDAASLPWYQDLTVCKQVDDRDTPYDAELLHRMYDFLSTHGDCYYIEYQGVLVGDVSLRENGEIAIVVCREYQNRHIGRRCVLEMLRLACKGEENGPRYEDQRGGRYASVCRQRQGRDQLRPEHPGGRRLHRGDRGAACKGKHLHSDRDRLKTICSKF